LVNSSVILSGLWFGTRRILIFALALEGRTVFAPSPIYPPQMLLTSNVGRMEVRPKVVNPFSPIRSFTFIPSSFYDSCYSASFFIGYFLHIIIETGDIDMPVFVMKGGDHSTQYIHRIGYGATVNAGVQIFIGANHFNFHVAQSPEACRDRRNIICNDTGVRDQ